MELLKRYHGHVVVLDMVSPYVAVGTLAAHDDHYLDLRNADIYDLRQSDVTREAYIEEAKRTGVRPNRDEVLIRREEVLSIAALDEVVS